MINQTKKKKAHQLAREIYRCEMILQEDDSTDLEVEQAITKIKMITKAYQNDLEMLLLLDLEIQKMLTK